jgi:hypothetical protein
MPHGEVPWAPMRVQAVRRSQTQFEWEELSGAAPLPQAASGPVAQRLEFRFEQIGEGAAFGTRSAFQPPALAQQAQQAQQALQALQALPLAPASPVARAQLGDGAAPLAPPAPAADSRTLARCSPAFANNCGVALALRFE